MMEVLWIHNKESFLQTIRLQCLKIKSFLFVNSLLLPPRYLIKSFGKVFTKMHESLIPWMLYSDPQGNANSMFTFCRLLTTKWLLFPFSGLKVCRKVLDDPRKLIDPLWIIVKNVCTPLNIRVYWNDLGCRKLYVAVETQNRTFLRW